MKLILVALINQVVHTLGQTFQTWVGGPTLNFQNNDASTNVYVAVIWPTTFSTTSLFVRIEFDESTGDSLIFIPTLSGQTPEVLDMKFTNLILGVDPSSTELTEIQPTGYTQWVTRDMAVPCTSAFTWKWYKNERFGTDPNYIYEDVPIGDALTGTISVEPFCALVTPESVDKSTLLYVQYIFIVLFTSISIIY